MHDMKMESKTPISGLLQSPEGKEMDCVSGGLHLAFGQDLDTSRNGTDFFKII